MATALVLGRVLGIVFTVTGLSMLINRRSTAAAIGDMVGDEGLLWLGGFTALAIGAMMLVFNNAWSSGLELWITILGWLAVLKGVALLMMPKAMASFYRRVLGGGMLTASAVVVLVVGLAMLYYAFM